MPQDREDSEREAEASKLADKLRRVEPSDPGAALVLAVLTTAVWYGWLNSMAQVSASRWWLIGCIGLGLLALAFNLALSGVLLEESPPNDQQTRLGVFEWRLHGAACVLGIALGLSAWLYERPPFVAALPWQPGFHVTVRSMLAMLGLALWTLVMVAVVRRAIVLRRRAAEAHPTTEPTGDTAGLRTIVIMAHGRDHEIADVAEREATDLGLDAKRCPPGSATAPRRALLVLLSATALDDEAFLAETVLGARAPYPVVPILLDAIPPAALPQAIGRHNWLDVSGLSPEQTRLELRRVLSMDPAAFLFFQDVAVRADRWQRTGCRADGLTMELGQARLAASRFDELHEQVELEQPAAISQYLENSVAYARGLARKRRWALGRRLLIGLTIVATSIGVGVYVKVQERQVIAALQVESDMGLNLDPQFYTFRAIQNADALSWRADRLAPVVRGLQRPWPTALLRPADALWVGSGSYDANGRYWTEYPDGRVVRWDAGTATAEATFQVTDGRFTFAVDPTGTKLTVATASGAQVYDTQTKSRVRIAPALNPYSPLATGSASGAGLRTTDGRSVIVTFDLATGQELGVSSAYDEVLDLRATAGGLRALARQGGDLILADIDHDVTIERLAGPSHPVIVAGTIAPECDRFAVAADGRLLIGASGTLTEVGVRTRDAPSALAMTRAGQLIVSTSQDGTHVVDTRLHTDLGRICTGQVGTVSIAVANESDQVACSSRFETEVWNVRSLAPIPSVPASNAISDRPMATSADVTVTTTARRLTVATSVASTDNAMATVAPGATGAITVAAVSEHGDGVLVGTADGWVAEFALVSTDATPPVLRQVQQWRVPTGDRIDAVGWSADGTTIVAGAADLWWTPISCLHCLDPDAAARLAKARQPPCWPEASIEIFPSDYRRDMGMMSCPAIPKPER